MIHILESQQFDRATIEKLFKTADALEKKQTLPLKGKILATLFYEPSTRTRLSFESAMIRLGGGVISVENARESSSFVKGESLEDTMRMINHYADVLVIRHSEQGAADLVAKVATIPVINAGDGAGQHPTQALMDLYTIYREAGGVDGKTIALVGDLEHSRTIRSLAYLLGKYKDVHVTFVSLPELKMKDDIKEYLARHRVACTETANLDEAMRDSDVVYQNRIQKERFPEGQGHDLSDAFVITRARADSMKKGAVIMNPLPRAGELLPEVDGSPHAAYFRQAGYGVLVRMALLKYLLG